jgi:hypothetical protein
MTWTLADPGLPPLPDGRASTPPVAPPRSRTKASVRWVAAKFGEAAVDRGRAARRRWAAVSDETIMDARRGLAMEIRRFTADPSSPRRVRQPLADRALALELSATAAEARDLTEIEAIGLRLEAKP